MALHATTNCSIAFHGDGTSTSVVVTFATAPFVFSGIMGSPAGLTPTSASSVTSSDGQVCTVTVGALGAITFAWPLAIGAGALVTVYLYLDF